MSPSPKTKHLEPRAGGWCNPPVLWGLHRFVLGKTKQLLHKRLTSHQSSPKTQRQGKNVHMLATEDRLNERSKKPSMTDGKKVVGSIPGYNWVELARSSHVGLLQVHRGSSACGASSGLIISHTRRQTDPFRLNHQGTHGNRGEVPRAHLLKSNILKKQMISNF